MGDDYLDTLHRLAINDSSQPGSLLVKVFSQGRSGLGVAALQALTGDAVSGLAEAGARAGIGKVWLTLALLH